MELLLWIVSFIVLWLNLVWIGFYLQKKPRALKPKALPMITIAMPCYNKETHMDKTFSSLLELDYPKERLEIIIVDDGSHDRTAEVGKRLISSTSDVESRLILLPRNKGKSEALNAALRSARGEYFACVDADSRVDSQALKHVIAGFSEKKTAAVISAIKVDEPKTLYEKAQVVEYLLINLIKRLMSSIDTLFITPGVLSIYDSVVLRKIGGFSSASGMTEDLEVAMRLRYHGYRIRMSHLAVTYTKVPYNFRMLWRQRIRWFRGFWFNHLKYRNMLLSRKYGLFGLFQMPYNLLGMPLLLLAVGMVGYNILKDFFELIVRSLTIKGYILNHLIEMPSLKEIILGNNIQLLLPVGASLASLLFIFYIAHKQFKENMLKNIIPLWIYLVSASYITCLHLVCALSQEILGLKRKW